VGCRIKGGKGELGANTGHTFLDIIYNGGGGGEPRRRKNQENQDHGATN